MVSLQPLPPKKSGSGFLWLTMGLLFLAPSCSWARRTPEQAQQPADETAWDGIAGNLLAALTHYTNGQNLPGAYKAPGLRAYRVKGYQAALPAPRNAAPVLELLPEDFEGQFRAHGDKLSAKAAVVTIRPPDSTPVPVAAPEPEPIITEEKTAAVARPAITAEDESAKPSHGYQRASLDRSPVPASRKAISVAGPAVPLEALLLSAFIIALLLLLFLARQDGRR